MPALLKHEFPSIQGKAYLDWAAVGAPPLRALNAVRSYYDLLERDPEAAMSTATQLKARQAAREALAPLVGCQPERLNLAGTSTTAAVQLAVDAIGPQKGDNVVVLDMDFPLMYQEAARLRMRGVEVRVVANSDGDYELDQFYSVIDRRTRALIVSSVQWVNGLRLDVGELAKLVHEVDGYIVVDAIQHVGALRLAADALNLDFVAFGTHKWLLAPFGAGFLCVGRRAAEELQPPRPGYLNMPVRDWDSFWESPSKEPFRYPPFDQASGLRFEYGGTFPPAPLLGAASSASLINEIGVENVEAHILRLRRELSEELEDMGAEVVSPPEASKASGILTFRLEGGPSRNFEVVRRLRARGIMVSGRGAAGVWGIRASLHFPNDEDDVEALVEALRGLRSL